MKCFVTGATGHVGCVLVRQLLELGHEVSIFVRKSSNLDPVNSLSVKIIYGELTDTDILSTVISNNDIVFHIAGMIHIGSGKYKQLYNINVNGTKTIADICLKYNKKLLYMSSVHAIRELPHGQVMKETRSFDPKPIAGTYGKTKAIATDYVLSLCKQGLDAVIVHPSGILGPYEYRMSNIGKFIRNYANGNIPAYIDGMYNFVDVRDVCAASINAAVSDISNECFLLTGSEVTVMDLLDILNKITKVKKPKLKVPYFIALISSFFSEWFCRLTRATMMFTPYSVKTLSSNGSFDNSKAKDMLKFNVRPVYETINDMYVWMKENNRL